ncbi:MAG: hypothetical protein ABI688_01645 [Bacteroidota bacterium]
MKKPVAKRLVLFHHKSKAMKKNIQKDPGNGGCCGGSITDMGCC